MAETTEHGFRDCLHDNIGGGWRMECLCGFTTGLGRYLSDAGEEMDDHFEFEGEAEREQEKA